MTSEPLVLMVDDSIDVAERFMEFAHIRHLPVVEKGKVVGMISDRDIKHVIGSMKTRQPVLRNEQVVFTLKSRIARTIMRRNVITTSLNADAAEAAAIMVKRRIGALPVIQKERLVGIITSTDILKAFVRLSSSLKSRDGG